MLFCPTCGSIMMPKEKNGKKVSECPKCGYVSADASSMKLKEKIKDKSKELGVVETSGDERLPTTDAECAHCGHKKAYYWTQQTRAADEGETKFLKCEKCKHTWREYG